MDTLIAIIIVAVFTSWVSYLGGVDSQRHQTLDKCVAYYADMPYNKVTDHCKTLLEFKKETSK